MDRNGSYWESVRAGTFRRRRLLASGGAAVALSAAAGCGRSGAPTPSQQSPATGSQASAGNPVAGGTYNYYQPSNAPTLDPQRTTSYFCFQPCAGVYSRIFGLKVGADPLVSEAADTEPDLGLSAESPDALTWTVKLRTDAKFQNVPPVNGHAVEVTDIKASWLRGVDAKNPNSGELDMIDPSQIQTPAVDTLVFTLKYPYAPFAKILAGPKYAWILPREATSGAYDPAKQMIGSGAFLLDSYTPDVAFTYKKNPDWFVKGQPYVDGMRYAIITDAAQQLAQFTAGNLDELDSIDGKNIDAAQKQNPKAKLYTGDSNQQYALVGQLGDATSPWADVRVRHAISMMIDRAAINASVFDGKATQSALEPPKFGKWALALKDVDPNVAANYKLDAAGAKTLLQQAGVGASPFAKLIYTANGYVQPYSTLAETVNSMINAQGVKTTLVNVDYNSEYVNGGKGIHYGNFNKDSLVFGMAGDGYVDIDQILYAFYGSKSTRKNTPINDSTFDSMMDKARTIVNDDQRLKAYMDIQRYLMDKTYFIAAWPVEPRFRLVQPWVQNYTFWADYAFMASTDTKVWLKKS